MPDQPRAEQIETYSDAFDAFHEPLTDHLQQVYGGELRESRGYAANVAADALYYLWEQGWRPR